MSETKNEDVDRLKETLMSACDHTQAGVAMVALVETLATVIASAPSKRQSRKAAIMVVGLLFTLLGADAMVLQQVKEITEKETFH